jgi:transcription-repair coupling factor (superfamily II helicase)
VLRLIRESGGSVKLDPDNPNVLLMNTEAIALKDKSEFIREKLQSLL